MSRTKKFIESLKDYELVALYKLRINSFMPNRQEEIKQIIRSRKINLENKFDYLREGRRFIEENKIEIYCPKCYSTHFYEAAELDVIYEKMSSYELHNKFRTCSVCLYSEEKESYNSEKKKGWSIFSTIRFLKDRGKRK